MEAGMLELHRGPLLVMWTAPASHLGPPVPFTTSNLELRWMYRRGRVGVLPTIIGMRPTDVTSLVLQPWFRVHVVVHCSEFSMAS